MRRRRAMCLAGACCGVLASVVGGPSFASATSALKKCAEIAEPASRLACYDRVAERPATPADVALAPPTATSPASTVAASTGATPRAAASKPAPANSFGLYTAEHPVAVQAPAVALKAKVLAVGSSSTGRPTVTLEGDQLWELDSSDPLLASGDTVTIKRAALGSFLMTTPSGRTHRLKRLR